jgi:choline kinase
MGNSWFDCNDFNFQKTMKAIILAGGLGTRLKPLTDKTPKPMIKIAGRPILEHIANHLNMFGIHEIIVNTHYLPEKIMNYFGTRFLYTYEPKLLGEEGTIYSVSHWIEKDFCVVVNGDTLTNLNINEMFNMSGGRNIKYMDKDVYAGTRIIEPFYWRTHNPSISYQTANAYWVDMGTKSGLKRAREIYETIN